MLRRAERKREELERGLASAVQADEAAYRRAQEGHVDSMVAWSEAVAFAERIIHGDGEAYAEAVEDTEPFSEIESFGSRPQFTFQSGLTLSLLHTFIQHAADEARVAFAKQLPRHLETLTPGARMEVWNKLIQRYWDDRCTNVPAPLATKEVGAMCAWVFALPEVAAEALSKLRASPGERFVYADTVIRKWQKDDAWVCANPTEAAGFIEFLTERNSLNLWMTQGAVVVLEKALAAGASQEVVRNAVERLVALS